MSADSSYKWLLTKSSFAYKGFVAFTSFNVSFSIVYALLASALSCCCGLPSTSSCRFSARYWSDDHHSKRSNIDSAASNLFGAATAVIVAVLLYALVNWVRGPYYNALLHRGRPSRCRGCMFRLTAAFIGCGKIFGCVLKTEAKKVQMAKDLKNFHKKQLDEEETIMLGQMEEELLVASIIDAENSNIWAILMPAVYMLVPGSMIAKLWYSSWTRPRKTS